MKLTHTLHVLVAAAFGLFWIGGAAGDETSPVAYVEVTCKGSKEPSAAEETQAMKSVKAALLEKYVSSLGAERKPTIEKKKNMMLAEVDAYIDNFTVRSRQFDKKNRVLTLAAQAEVNTAKVDQLIDQGVQGEKNPIVFIFVARRQAEVSGGPQNLDH